MSTITIPKELKKFKGKSSCYDFHVKAVEIADVLPGYIYVFNPRQTENRELRWYVVLKHQEDDFLSISLYLDDYKNRIEISPLGRHKVNGTEYTTHNYTRVQQLQIGVSADKPAERIAKDITRRLLGKLAEVMGPIKQKTQEANAEQCAVLEKYKHLKEKYGFVNRSIDNGRELGPFSHLECWAPGDQLHKVTLWAKSASLDLHHCSYETFEKILELLKADKETE